MTSDSTAGPDDATKWAEEQQLDSYWDALVRGDTSSVNAEALGADGAFQLLRDLYDARELLREEAIAVADQAEPIPEFADYERLTPIARGGMGIVYRAKQKSLGRTVALKMIRDVQMFPGEVERFQREAQSAAQIRHPNIVPVYEVGEHQGHHYYTMEYIDGPSLSEMIATELPTVRHSVELMQAIASAIESAHQHGILHRDLKPSNVLIDHTRQPRVTDFGLARGMNKSSDLTMTGIIVGTPSYMSPEQALAQTLTAASDVYSLGAVLYELLTGRPPFRSDSPIDTIRQVTESEPVPPSTLNDSVPRDVETICLRCLAKRPEQRFPTAQALADELGRVLRGEPILSRPIGRLGRGWRWCRRKPVVAGLSATIVVVLLTAIPTISRFWWLANKNAESYRKAAELAEEKEEIATASVVRLTNAMMAFSRVTAGLDQSDASGKYLTELFRLMTEIVRKSPTDSQLKDQIAATALALAQNGVNLASRVEAIPALEQATRLYEELARVQPNSAEYAIGGARCQMIAARFHYNGQRLDEAIGAFAAARDLYQRALRLDPDSKSAKLSIVSALGNIAILQRQKGQTDESDRTFADLVALLERMLEDDPQDAATRVQLARTYGHVASQRPIEERLAYYEKALALRLQLLSESTSGVNRHGVARSYEQIAHWRLEHDQLAEALDAIQLSVEQFEAIEATDSAVVDWKVDMAYVFAFRAKIAAAQEDATLAVESFRAALSVLDAIVAAGAEHQRARQGLRDFLGLFVQYYLDVGDAASALPVLNRRASLITDQPAELYDLARQQALTAGLKPDTAADLADQSIASLNAAVQSGFDDWERLGDDVAWEELKARDDFPARPMEPPTDQ